MTYISPIYSSKKKKNNTYDFSRGETLLKQYESQQHKRPGSTDTQITVPAGFRNVRSETSLTQPKTGTSKKIQETANHMQASQQIVQARNNYLASQTEKVKRPTDVLYNTSLAASKTAKYRQISEALGNLAKEREERAGRQGGTASIVQGGFGLAGSIASFFSGPVGGIISAFGLLIGSGIASGASKTAQSAETYSQMAQNITDYLSNLTQRDTTIMNTMDQIYSSMDNMRGAYGREFVDMMYNYYLGRSGMTPDAYSMLTGNFETFEGIGYGNVSAERGLFDTLTDGNQNMFNNMYATISAEDILGTSFMDDLVNSLYSSKTEFGISLRSYETQLRDSLKQALLGESNMLSDFGGQLDVSNASARAENISYAESIGEAQAEASSSGARGGTSYSNVRLAELSRDLGQIQRAASIAASIGSLKYNIQNMRANASATAYNYRVAQEKAVTGAVTEAAIGFTSIGRTARQGERNANYYLGEAQSYERQFMDKYEGLDATDADRMFEVIYR